MTLTPAQIKAAKLLGQGYSQQDAAVAIGVTRRTIGRWQKQEDFRHLCFGLIHRAPQSTPQRASERSSQPETLKVEDLIPDALKAVQEILQDPDSRNADRLKAAALVGEWVGLGDRQKMAEMQALEVLIQAGWVHDEAINTLVANWEILSSEMKDVLRGK
jgi:transcriptional regulator with XRE-family HTH domain